MLGLSPINPAESHADSARAHAQAAKDRLSSIISAISGGTGKLDALRKLLDEERQTRSRVARYLDGALEQAQTSVTSAEKDVARRHATADAAAASRAGAQEKLAQSIIAIDDTLVSERKAFEASDHFVEVESRVSTHVDRLAQVSKTMEIKIAADPSVVKAQQEADDAERMVRQMRNEPRNETAVSQASQSWIDAKSRLTKARRVMLESNESYQQTIVDLREAQREMTVLKAKFESSLSSLPAVVAAVRARDLAEQALRVSEGEEADSQAALQLALDSLAQNRMDVEVLSAMKRDPEAQMRKIDASIEGVRSELAEAGSAASSATSDLAASLSAIECIDSDLDNAAAEFARLERELAEAKQKAK
jgi:chromosome segregation ATPase